MCTFTVCVHVQEEVTVTSCMPACGSQGSDVFRYDSQVFLFCFILRHSLLLNVIDSTKMASQRATGILLSLLPPALESQMCITMPGYWEFKLSALYLSDNCYPSPWTFLQLLPDYASPTQLSGSAFSHSTPSGCSGIARRLCLRQR